MVIVKRLVTELLLATLSIEARKESSDVAVQTGTMSRRAETHIVRTQLRDCLISFAHSG